MKCISWQVESFIYDLCQFWEQFIVDKFVQYKIFLVKAVYPHTEKHQMERADKSRILSSIFSYFKATS